MLARIVFGLVGLGCLFGAVWIGVSTARFVASAERAEGEVVALTAGGSHPRVRFSAPDGSAVVFNGHGLIFGYEVGQRAPVLYRAIDPAQTATLAAVGALWFVPLVLAAIGTAGVVVARQS